MIETDYIHAIEINNMKKPPQRPLRREIPYRPIHAFEVSLSKNPVISGPSSSCKILAKATTQHRMQHRIVVDLTSDSDEENLIVETQPLSAPKVTMKLSCLDLINNDFF